MKFISPMKIWHQVVESGDMNLLDDILDKDCIFYSPVVFSPQAGKEITKKYLSAAAIVFADESFKYTKEIESAKLACLEFELVLNEIKINGIDIATPFAGFRDNANAYRALAVILEESVKNFYQENLGTLIY